MSIRAVRGEILYFRGHPEEGSAKASNDGAVVHHDDGILLIDKGSIVAVGPASEVLPQLGPDIALQNYPHSLILPGFIDSHIHLPQVDVIASHGTQLLDWLERYTFPAEQLFADHGHAVATADFFLQQLIQAGTTTAMVFATIHAHAVDAFFRASEALGTRMICGRVMMDTNAPDALCDTAESSYHESRALIERWHGCGRQLYAVTPRFAITSSPQQLGRAGELLDEFPGVYLQTHLSENLGEVEAVRQLHPHSQDYLDVYDQHRLVRRHSVFAHGLHLSAREHACLHEAGAGIAFCPTSNLFLGSGLLDLAKLDEAGVAYGMATDVGGGTSFSMLQTLNEAYKVAQLQGQTLSPLKAFYLATLGNARMLGLEARVGTLEVGTEADFIMLDYHCTDLIRRRVQRCQSLEERLFVLMMLGDDRAVAATWVNGQCVYDRPNASVLGTSTNGTLGTRL
ncbi:guanine deaminase [Allohahella marinimesophila]|uniref:Guanine deaminase n=1 Tax=Allohahella marinimesophila TaxID=1054972 RepID=A0ABP7PFK2_9GAMM